MQQLTFDEIGSFRLADIAIMCCQSFDEKECGDAYEKFLNVCEGMTSGVVIYACLAIVLETMQEITTKLSPQEVAGLRGEHGES